QLAILRISYLFVTAFFTSAVTYSAAREAKKRAAIAAEMAEERINAQQLRESAATRQRYIEQVIVAQDNERRRLAHELHDGLGQSLTSLSVSLRALEHRDASEATRQQIRGLASMTQNTLHDVRRMARGLHPAVLDELGFCAAVHNLAGSMA